MTEYKSILPEITLKYKKGEILKCKISSSKDCNEVFRKFYDEDVFLLSESFIVLFLNKANNSIGWYKLSTGGITGTVADLRLLFAAALNCAATSIILSHNHPSGNLKPSDADVKLTRKIKDAGFILDITVIDHLIITEENYYSFADEGIL